MLQHQGLENPRWGGVSMVKGKKERKEEEREDMRMNEIDSE